MKAQIAKLLSIFLALVLIFLLVLTHYLKTTDVENSHEASSRSTISQIQDILIANDADLENLTDSLREEYIIKAQMVAYIFENVEISSIYAYRELATMMDIDEIHVFDEDGVIYNGSEPKYWGYSFDSGDQMLYFEPMLYDKSLTLCQDITPNTAEEKPMMYIATWDSIGENIIQIGVEPQRILDAQSKNELSYIFSSMPTDDNTTLLAVDALTSVILGSSNTDYTNLNTRSIGLYPSDSDEAFYQTIDGTECFCVFVSFDDVYIGVLTEKDTIDADVLDSMISTGGYFLIATLFSFFILLKLIDFWILKDISRLIDRVSAISEGKLDTNVDVGTSPEFKKLCKHLNMMVSSLLNTTAKMSNVLDYVDTKIAVYEYKKDMNRVFSTRKLGELLDIPAQTLDDLLTNKELFENEINSLKAFSTEHKHIYSRDGKKFIKLETLAINEDQYGVVEDVSATIQEKILLEHERDYDLLTELYNRRACFRELDELFHPDAPYTDVAILALDMDMLKEINDTYGHDGGDLAIKTASNIMRGVQCCKKILARMGGDEFLIVLYCTPDCCSPAGCIAELDKSFKSTYIEIAGNSIPIRMSGGYLFCSNRHRNYDTLLKYADEALYTAKKNGKNAFIEYSGTID